MDDVRLAMLARMQGGVVTTSQILLCGLTRAGIAHRVATARLFPVQRGAFTLGPQHDRATSWWAAVLVADPRHAMLSHWSAAQAHGFWTRSLPVVHVIVPGTGGRRVAGLTIHAPRSVSTFDVGLVGGLRTTRPARTILDIAARADDAVVRSLIREAEFQGQLRAGEMARAVAAHPRHPGTATVRRVDPETAQDALGQTVLEDELEALLAATPLPAPERQVAVQGHSGAGFRFDFAWPSMRLAAEADGRAAHERASALDDDRLRDNDLAAVGWLTMRFTRTQIARHRLVSMRQVVATAQTRGWQSVVD